eukprot:1305594-Prymnesium_polylepis.1
MWHADGERVGDACVCYGSTGTADANRHACGDAQTTRVCITRLEVVSARAPVRSGNPDWLPD